MEKGTSNIQSVKTKTMTKAVLNLVIQDMCWVETPVTGNILYC